MSNQFSLHNSTVCSKIQKTILKISQKYFQATMSLHITCSNGLKNQFPSMVPHGRKTKLKLKGLHCEKNIRDSCLICSS